MVYPADDTYIRITLLRRALREMVERTRALSAEARRREPPGRGGRKVTPEAPRR